MSFVPAVIIRHERDREVADLRFPSQLGLLQICHADEIHPPLPVQVRFRLGRKGRAFHAHVRAPLFRADPDSRRGAVDAIHQFRADRIGEGNVRHETFAKERGNAPASSIEELIR